MSRKPILLAVLFLLSVAGFQQAGAQVDDDRKFEVGGQFSLIRVPTYSLTAGLIGCLNPSACPLSLFFGEGGEKNEPGFGGRLGYNLNRYFALEAEANYFPRDRDADGGRKAQVLAGAKVGKRFEKVGLFGKARPGFVRFSQGDYRPGPNVCAARFPPSIACFESDAKTNFALDLGGVAEFYPSKKTIIRFDAGDTMIFFGDRNVAAPAEFGGSFTAVLPRASETRHNLQISAGFAFRF
jgi:hypothetical protein